MQMFLITNGKQWVTKGSVNSVKTCNSPSFAKEFWYEQGRKVLLANKSLDGFWLEGVEDFLKIPKNHLLHNKHNMTASDNDGSTDALLANLDMVVGDILSVDIPEKKSLIKQKDTLLNKLQWYDLALSDIVHWAQYNNPPAHIRTKVYGYLSTYRSRRAEIKEKIRYVEILLEFYEGKSPFSGLVGQLKKATDAQYKPDTTVYAELDALLK